MEGGIDTLKGLVSVVFGDVEALAKMPSNGRQSYGVEKILGHMLLSPVVTCHTQHGREQSRERFGAYSKTLYRHRT